jgi:hypothetical protein
MSYNWGPYYIVPSTALEKYSGSVMLREDFDADLLSKELGEIGITGPIVKVVNPWYYRRKSTETWIKIGESEDRQENFPVRWDTTNLSNGKYEVLGLMHVFIKVNGESKAVARENVVEVEVEH